jgi:poly(beta-D-mannuronate) lyase
MKKSIIGLLILTAFLSQMTVWGQKPRLAKTLAAPAAVLLADDFESYATFPAGSWVNNNGSAVWTIETDGSRVARQSAALTSIVSNGNFAWTNYRVSARVKPQVLGFRNGIIARFTSSSAYYSLYLRHTASGGTKVVELNKRVGGSNVVLQTVSVPLTAGTFYKLTLDVDGSSLKGYVNDELKVQATDADYTAGKAGFYNTGDTSYDDFSVEDSSGPPSAPTNLAAAAASGQINLTWSAASGANGYTVKRSTADGGPFENIATAVTSAGYVDTNINFGTVYYYVVSANNAAGESANSNQASALARLDSPAAPGGLHTASGNGEAKIYWTASATAASYHVKRSLTSGGTYTTVGANVAGSEFTDSGLTNGTTYFYKVSAVNAAGESALSSATSASPRLGQIVNVATQTELQNALNNAVAGDEIILADGNYSAFKVRRKYGTAETPVIVRAQNPRGAVFNAGQMELQNTIYMTFEGFRWTLSTSIKLRGTQFNRLTRNSFELNETGLTDLDWVSIGAADSHHNRVDHNDFKNKVTLGNYITLSGENAQVTQYDLIDHNYFFNLGPRADNEKETIRVGDSSVSQSSGFTVIEHNLFEQCDGDPEIVSVKTNDNIVRYNTFRRSKGGLTARQGNRSQLYGNFFLGENTEGTGGIRAYGNDHKIFNNYFEGLTGTANYAPIAITNGDADGAELPGADQSKHYRPQRITIANNTLVGNASNIEIGGSYTLAPRDITLADNLIVGNAGEIVKYRTAPINPVYAGNIYDGTAVLGITATETQFRKADPLLVTENGVQKLGAGSPAIDASANNYDYVAEDFEGQTRDALRDVGADEFGAFVSQRRPLTAANAGLNANDHAISGRVVGANGQGLPEVRVGLVKNQAALTGTTAAATQTDADGYFYLTDVVPGENYTLSFSKNQYSFSPAAVNVSNLNADVNLNTSGTFLVPTAARVSVSGQVRRETAPVANAIVSLTGQTGESISVRTNSFGNFNFEVPAGQTYVLTAQAKGAQFEAQVVTVADAVSGLIISALPY